MNISEVPANMGICAEYEWRWGLHASNAGMHEVVFAALIAMFLGFVLYFALCFVYTKIRKIKFNRNDYLLKSAIISAVIFVLLLILLFIGGYQPTIIC